MAAYHQPEVWQRLVDNGMREDFSWGRSAQQYLEIYLALQKRKAAPVAETEAANE
jgi:starch synthase